MVDQLAFGIQHLKRTLKYIFGLTEGIHLFKFTNLYYNEMKFEIFKL